MENQTNNNEKIWGLYPGSLTEEEIVKLEEVDVWIKIHTLSNKIFWDMQDMGKPWVKSPTANQLEKDSYALEYLMYYTRNYGVEFNQTPSATEHVERSDSYSAWYSFWYNHFSSMPTYRYNEFIDAKYLGKDISHYMPTGNWQQTQSRTHIRKR